jgi:hypothetical protein
MAGNEIALNKGTYVRSPDRFVFLKSIESENDKAESNRNLNQWK